GGHCRAASILPCVLLEQDGQSAVLRRGRDCRVFEDLLRACGMRSGLAYYRAAPLSVEQNRALSRDRKLPMPVLGLSADLGSIPDMSAALRPFANEVRGETIANCGHFQHDEQPEAVADALARFFSSV